MSNIKQCATLINAAVYPKREEIEDLSGADVAHMLQIMLDQGGKDWSLDAAIGYVIEVKNKSDFTQEDITAIDASLAKVGLTSILERWDTKNNVVVVHSVVDRYTEGKKIDAVYLKSLEVSILSKIVSELNSDDLQPQLCEFVTDLVKSRKREEFSEDQIEWINQHLHEQDIRSLDDLARLEGSSTWLPLSLNQYQKQSQKTAIYPRDRALEYTVLGLLGEAGEIANKAKKIIRGDKTLTEIDTALADELGDVLWYVAAVADALGYDLDVIAQRNLDKLADRAERGKIKGDGDER